MASTIFKSFECHEYQSIINFLSVLHPCPQVIITFTPAFTNQKMVVLPVPAPLPATTATLPCYILFTSCSLIQSF
jgi:hypothetical protein